MHTKTAFLTFLQEILMSAEDWWYSLVATSEAWTVRDLYTAKFYREHPHCREWCYDVRKWAMDQRRRLHEWCREDIYVWKVSVFVFRDESQLDDHFWDKLGETLKYLDAFEFGPVATMLMNRDLALAFMEHRW